MGKRTKKQHLTQLANEKAARKCISIDQKLVKTIYASKVTPQATSSAPHAFQILGHNQGTQKTNLLLRDSHSGSPLLMRISPTLQYKQRKGQQSANDGYECFQKVKAKIPDRETRGCFELGIYHSIGHSYFGFSAQTKGKDNEEATGLLNWAKEHTSKHLITAKHLLPAEWQDNMDSRKDPNEFVKSVFKEQANLLSPWWITTTFFDSFTGVVHDDQLDHKPSFLFNFGSPCYLVLHDYNIKVQLDHLNIAVFNINTLLCSTHAVGDGERWAFSAFYRKSIYDKKGPTHISKETLNKVLKDEGRFRSANQ